MNFKSYLTRIVDEYPDVNDNPVHVIEVTLGKRRPCLVEAPDESGVVFFIGHTLQKSHSSEIMHIEDLVHGVSLRCPVSEVLKLIESGELFSSML